MKLLNEYQNGNTFVQIFDDGTKIRKYEDFAKPIFPESMDVKITNYCDAGCSFCHEMSSIEGKHADLEVLFETIKDLPAGVELAIGGGNPLTHPEFYNFLLKAREKGWICNLTVNQKHLKDDLLNKILDEKLIYGLGISYTSKAYFSDIKKILEKSDNVVFHLINGINKPSDVDDLIGLNLNTNNKQTKVLLLGYKSYGFGLDYLLKKNKVEEIKKQWLWKIRSVLDKPGLIMSFDNLAIEQTELKRFFPQKEWDKFYMGDEFTFSMYIDAIEQKYAPTSTTKEKVSFKTKSLFKYFQDKK
jgi:organic radical activating enzyme